TLAPFVYADATEWPQSARNGPSIRDVARASRYLWGAKGMKAQRPDLSTPIEWLGDLNDDCKAQWAGLMLHAERMDRTHWWWAVTLERTGEQVASSHGSAEPVRAGKAARSAAEAAARSWLTDLALSKT
ncbi:MAG TPA: hypothetical protein PLR35_18675, partial [Burkholderiaceae bacterium]|nr:hypothetical protein [Burkholderiaceae bacterium]